MIPESWIGTDLLESAGPECQRVRNGANLSDEALCRNIARSPVFNTLLERTEFSCTEGRRAEGLVQYKAAFPDRTLGSTEYGDGEVAVLPLLFAEWNGSTGGKVKAMGCSTFWSRTSEALPGAGVTGEYWFPRPGGIPQEGCVAICWSAENPEIWGRNESSREVEGTWPEARLMVDRCVSGIRPRCEPTWDGRSGCDRALKSRFKGALHRRRDEDVGGCSGGGCGTGLASNSPRLSVACHDRFDSAFVSKSKNCGFGNVELKESDQLNKTTA